MTITTTANKKIFTANGATTVFGWDFFVPDAASLVVQTVNSSGVVTTVTTGFTSTGYGTSSGSVTFAVAPATGQVVLSRNISQTQGSDFTNQDGFYPEVIEAALDKLTMLVQQVNELVGRAVKQSVADTGSVTLPTAVARANQLLGFDGSGNPIAAGSIPSNLAAIQAACEAARDAALAAYDTFDDRFLGSKTADPTLDNDGNTLLPGALYYNSVSQAMKVWTGSAWVAAYVSGSGYLAAANNLSDVSNVSTARGNLGLADAATKTEAFLRTLPFTTQRTGAYVAQASDAGQTIPITTGGVTINNSVFSANQVFSIYNESDSTQTLTQGAGMTLRKMGVASITGTQTIPARGYVTLHVRASNEVLVTGVA